MNVAETIFASTKSCLVNEPHEKDGSISEDSKNKIWLDQDERDYLSSDEDHNDNENEIETYREDTCRLV